MPRPKYIADLHAAKYDLRFCSRAEKPAMLRAYLLALENACTQSGVSGALLEAAVAPDFHAWVKEEKLPKPPRPT